MGARSFSRPRLKLTAEQNTYRGISLTRKRTLLGPYRRPMPRLQGGSWGGGRFLISEVPLQRAARLLLRPRYRVRSINIQGFKDVHLKARTRFWSQLFCISISLHCGFGEGCYFCGRVVLNGRAHLLSPPARAYSGAEHIQGSLAPKV